MANPKNKPAEDKPTEDKPAEGKPAEGKPAEGKPAEGKLTEDKPVEVPDLSEAIAGITAEIASIKQAISALANQGAVDESVATDNGEEYPEIDIDEVNRLMGV